MILRIVINSVLAPQLLSPPPYLLSSSGLGLFMLGSFVGIVLGYPIAGPLTDLLSRRLTKRRDRHLPEHRLPALIIPFVICPPGLLLFAYIINQHGSIYTAAVGTALQTAALVFVPSVVLSVVVDAYPETGSEALVLINAGKNLIAFGITVSVPTWLHRYGLVKMFWQMAAAQWAVLSLGVPLFFFGPWLRNRTQFLI
jgi:MFS family permease